MSANVFMFLGAVLLVGGFFLLVTLANKRRITDHVRDWPNWIKALSASVLVVSLTLLTAGVMKYRSERHTSPYQTMRERADRDGYKVIICADVGDVGPETWVYWRSWVQHQPPDERGFMLARYGNPLQYCGVSNPLSSESAYRIEVSHGGDVAIRRLWIRFDSPPQDGKAEKTNIGVQEIAPGPDGAYRFVIRTSAESAEMKTIDIGPGTSALLPEAPHTD